MNVPPKIGLAMRSVPLHDLQTVYGTEDLEDILEVMMIDAHNTRAMNRRSE